MQRNGVYETVTGAAGFKASRLHEIGQGFFRILAACFQQPQGVQGVTAAWGNFQGQ